MGFKHVIAPFSAWARAFAKPYTVPKDESMREAAPSYRGWHINELEKCVGCGTCHDICQNAALDMVPNTEATKGDSGLRPRVDYGRCCWCALCVDVCPSGSLAMSNEYSWSTSDAEEFIYTPGVDKKAWDDCGKGWRKDDDTFSLLAPHRVPMEMLDGDERIKHWAEVVVGYTEEQAQQEASRCVSCGICVTTCPAHMHIPDYITAIRDGEYQKAVNLIYDNNPFPEMCGKVCTRRCEDVCVVGMRGEPVAIRWLKRFATERFDDLRGVIKPTAERSGSGETVAVIGAGPSGITVAYYLAIRGFAVTVFEALPKAGGATFFGIPKYRFPMSSLDKQVALLESAGVEFKYNHKVEAPEFERLQKDYDAIFVGAGLMRPRALRAPGEDLPGVMHAIDLLRDHHLGKEVPVKEGQKVVVVGGGNVAIDAARISRRLGAEVTIAYRRRHEDMPADWEEIEDAEAERVDINTQAVPLRVEKLDDGRLDFVWGPAEMQPDPRGGRPRPVLIEGVENHLEVDLVVPAIGQAPEMSWLPASVRDTICDKGGWIKVDDGGMTQEPGVFAGGDLVNETADAISAIADGLRAVEGIQRHILRPVS